MKPHQAYRRNAQSGWTRIEMLLAIYDATITSLDNGIDALNQNRTSDLPALQLRATQLCLLLVSGIDMDGSQIANHLRDLCIFCIEQVRTRDVAAWTSARDILTTLREGFQEIRAEGIRLEAEGQISPLPQDASHVFMHV